MGILKFPTNLSEQIVSFMPSKKNSGLQTSRRATAIFLPTPIAFELTDGATYTTLELGATAGGITAAALANLFASKGDNTFGVGLKAAQKLGVDLVANMVESKGMNKDQQGFIFKKIRSPESNTAFAGHTIRNYKFSFLMAPSNPAEAAEIQNIIKHFKLNLYAAADDGIFLDYPPIWKVEFLSNNYDYLTNNKFYPKLWRSYLTSLSSNFNPNANGYYSDGSPVEIRLDLSFQETRALTQKDIIDLEDNNDPNLGLDARGNAATTGAFKPPPDEPAPPEPPKAASWLILGGGMR